MLQWNNQRIKTVYCVGIGGVGVGVLAQYLNHLGCIVKGCDQKPSAMTKSLTRVAVDILYENDERHLEGVDLLVHTAAAKPNHPLLRAAKKAGIPVVVRGKLLADIVNQSNSVVVAGTHGKTTTSSLIAYLFNAVGSPVNSFVGGSLIGEQGPAKSVDSDWVVAEADESDASFLYLKPTIAVITNVDPDHLESYRGNFDVLKQSFLQFTSQIDQGGVLIACLDHPVVRSLLPQVDCRVITYGFSDDADVRACDYRCHAMTSDFTVHYLSECCDMSLPLMGRHNAENTLAAIAVAMHRGVSLSAACNGLLSFPGVNRRLQSHGEVTLYNKRLHVYEDYGHHPEELAATISACQQAFPDRQLVMLFQPHRYSRTSELFDDFVTVLSRVDCLLMLPVYSAGESPIEGRDSRALAKAIAGHSTRSPTLVDIDSWLDCLPSHLEQDAIWLFQGAGSVGQLIETFKAHAHQRAIE